MINSMKMTALALSMTVAGSALACSIQGQGNGGFLPENDFYIPANSKSVSGGITEAQFNSLIDKVQKVYEPIVASAGGKLVIDRKWKDGTVNAYASQSGKTWSIAMFGGLARHETITEDGMSLVVCHELGHHIGGTPKVGGSSDDSGGWWGGSSSSGSDSWASNEGQADYFANLKCLRKVFLNADNAAIVAKLNAPTPLVSACRKSTKNNADDMNLCIRASMAGKSVANLFSALSSLPDTKFDTPDPKVVTATNDAHPKAQCRLDTYFQGSLCDVSFNEDVSNTDENKGTCSVANGDKIGNRPLCWFKPKK